jgi:hypothetical protein
MSGHSHEPDTADGGVVELTREEGRAMLGERTRRELGMTLEQFEAAYDAGTLDMARSDVIGLVMLMPFARLQILYFWPAAVSAAWGQ